MKLLSFPDTISSLLGGLFRLAVTVQPGRPIASAGAIAVYVFDDGTTAAGCVCDLPLAGYLSGAMMMVPALSVVEAVDSGELTEDLADGLRECLNVMAQIFNSPGGRHVTISQIYVIPAVCPDEVVQDLIKLPRKVHFDVQIAGYGSGAMSLLT